MMHPAMSVLRRDEMQWLLKINAVSRTCSDADAVLANSFSIFGVPI